MIRVDTASFTPFYEQVKQQVRNQIGTGTLRAGDPLPSIRELASSLLLNPNTVARAYRELEKEALITTRKGRGCFVAAGASELVRKGRLDDLGRMLGKVVDESRRLELTPDALKNLLDRSLQRKAKTRQGRKQI
jgi:GntR family transcriptional regulator